MTSSPAERHVFLIRYYPAQSRSISLRKLVVIDYVARPETSLSKTDPQLKQAEKMLLTIPELESYSRRTGARLAFTIAEAHSGDFLIKLKSDRKRTTDQVISELQRG